MNRARWLLWFLLLELGASLGGRGVEITGGPEVVPGETSAVIRWVTDQECGSRVRFGPRLDRLDGRASGEVGTQHSVTLETLRPGTTYHYVLGTARVSLATNSFTTRSASGDIPGDSSGKPQIRPASPSLPRPPPSSLTWGSPRTLPDHFDRHGGDFRAVSAEDYAAQAWLFLVRACADGLPAKQDSEGVVRVFDSRSGAFAAYNRDGTTKTYFKPGRRGYFEDQPGEPVDLRKLKQFRPPQ